MSFYILWPFGIYFIPNRIIVAISRCRGGKIHGIISKRVTYFFFWKWYLLDTTNYLFLTCLYPGMDRWFDQSLLWFYFPSWSWSKIKSFSNLCSFYSQIAVVVKGPFIASVKWKSWILQFGLKMGKQPQFSDGENTKRFSFKILQHYNPQIFTICFWTFVWM